MSETFSLELSEAAAQRVRRYAEQTKRPVEVILSQWIEQYVTKMPVDLLSDDEVLMLSELQLPDDQQAALSQLLQKQQNEQLNTQEQERLDQLMQVYNQALVRKAEALRELSRRELNSADDAPAS